MIDSLWRRERVHSNRDCLFVDPVESERHLAVVAQDLERVDGRDPTRLFIPVLGEVEEGLEDSWDESRLAESDSKDGVRQSG